MATHGDTHKVKNRVVEIRCGSLGFGDTKVNGLCGRK